MTRPIDLDAIQGDAQSLVIIPTPRAELEPATSRELVVINVSEKKFTRLDFLKADVKEALIDGRVAIYSITGIWIAGAGLFVYLFINALMTAMHLFVTGAIVLGLSAVALWLCRPPAPPSKLYLKGCPNRSPGVHEVNLCTKEH